MKIAKIIIVIINSYTFFAAVFWLHISQVKKSGYILFTTYGWSDNRKSCDRTRFEKCLKIVRNIHRGKFLKDDDLFLI